MKASVKRSFLIILPLPELVFGVGLRRTSCSRYQPQMVSEPSFWSMHCLKLLMSFSHTLGAWYSDEAAADCWGAASAGADEPPPKKPPMAWPMLEPTATPLCLCQLLGLLAWC